MGQYDADDDAGRLVITVALAQCVIIPAQKTANLVGVVGSQINTSFTTEAIGPRTLSHILILYYASFVALNGHTLMH